MRRALAVLAVAAAGASGRPGGSHDPVPRLVWSGPGVNLLGAPSRDGRYLSYVDPATGALALRELATGRSRALARPPVGSGEFAYFSVISPDSRRVAYAWFNGERFYDLRVAGLDGANQRVLYRNEEAGFVQPCAWSPDSKFILTLLFRSDNISQITLIPAEGGPPKILRSLNWVYPKRMDLSPDGRFIAYDSFADETSGQRTLFLLSIDGTRERRLIHLPGDHLFPLWTPDGQRIVYASDRSGAMDAWEMPVANGEPRGEPRLLRRDLGRILPLGITAAGDWFYGLRTGTIDVFVTTLGAPARDARRATLRFPGRNSAPAWSPDGKSLAFLSRRGSENFGQESRAIVVRRLDSEEERELLPRLAHLERVRWSPDGKSLLVSGSDNKGRAGVYRVDPLTAAVEPLATEAGASFRGFEAVWSADGSSIYYIIGEEVRRREIASGRESTLYRAVGLRGLAVSPDGKWLAAGVGGRSIALLRATGGEPQLIPFEGLTELEWGAGLIAGKGAELWRIPPNGPPARIACPGNREPGFSLHPDGRQIALTAGNARSEVWVLPLR